MGLTEKQTTITVYCCMEVVAHAEHIVSPQSEGGALVTPREHARLLALAREALEQADTTDLCEAMADQIRRRGPKAGLNKPLTRRRQEWLSRRVSIQNDPVTIGSGNRAEPPNAA